MRVFTLLGAGMPRARKLTPWRYYYYYIIDHNQIGLSVSVFWPSRVGVAMM